jgi:hypothetical protein
VQQGEDPAGFSWSTNRQVIHVPKLRSSTLRGALNCILFAAAILYLEARIRPQVLYYWNPELFPKTFAFFSEIALLPGGLTTYADKFLFQLNALPWLGALSTASFAFLAGVFSNRIYSALTNTRSSFFLVLPLFFVLCTLNQFRILPLTKLLSALVLADVFIRLPARNALLRIFFFFIASCFFILTIQDLYWLFVALCILSEILRREDRRVGVWYAVLAFVMLWVDHRYLYLVHTKVEPPGIALSSAIHRSSLIEEAILAGLGLLAVAVAYRKRTLSGLALLPILFTGYVDLQTWLPSSKAFFAALVAAPLLSMLRSGRRTSESKRWPVWTQAASIGSLALLGTMTIGLSFNDYWSSVLRLNFYSATKQWAAILEEVQNPSLADASPILVSPFILEALHHTGGLPDELFKYRQLYPPYVANVTPETLREDMEKGKYIVNLQQNARVCFELGLINYAELTAYDVMEYRSDLLSSYQLLALTYLLKGNYEASRPFLLRIKQNLLSSEWADRYLTYANDPKRMESDAYLMSIKSRMLPTDDPLDGPMGLMRRPPFFEIAHRLATHNPEDRMVREYLLSSYLINGQLAKIYGFFFQSDGSAAALDAGAIPRVCQEAALMYLAATGQEASPAIARRIHETTFRDFMEYSEILQRKAAGFAVNTSAYASKFGTTYLYYYTSLTNQSLTNQRQSWTYTIEPIQ